MAALAGPASAASLQVMVAGVRNDTGDVLVAVCSERRFLKESCEYNGRAKARKGDVLVMLEVPPGTYAVQAYHDEDMNGQVTMNALGLPIEGIGFSNDAPFRFTAPSYRDASFRVGPMGGRIRLTLRYLF
ncbi:MAG: DUF2141 domain-containing protein [Acetobacteraceae bacterium]